MAQSEKRKKRLALVTIGQTPRVDIVPDLLGAIEMDFDYQEFGALDGLGPEELKALAPEGDEPCLVTRLTDGSEIICSEAAIDARLQKLFAGIDKTEFDAILMLCSGELTHIEHPLPVFFPFKFLDEEVEEHIAKGDKIGMISPNAKQISKMKAHFPAAGDGLFTSASPYGLEEFERAGRELQGADFIIMNCMGYDSAMADKVGAASNVATTTVRQIFMRHVARRLAAEEAA